MVMDEFDGDPLGEPGGEAPHGVIAPHDLVAGLGIAEGNDACAEINGVPGELIN